MDKQFLEKVASFVRDSVEEIQSLQEKHAEHMEKQAMLERSVYKAAQALYESDYLLDEYEKKVFVKKALQDPAVLSNMIVKMANAADVSVMGRPAHVSLKTGSAEEFDPIKARCFGWSSSYDSSFIDE